MIALLALLPCAAVILAVLVLRWSGLAAAGVALMLAAALWLAALFAPLDLHALPRAVVDGLLLCGLVGSVIVSGLLYVEVARRIHSLEALSGVIRAMDLDPPRAAIVIVTGVGVLLESLTGFGVSLLVTIPLLATLYDRSRTIGLGLIGMSLMPWGALSVSALLGAALAGLPVETLAEAFLWTSGPVAFALPFACLVFVRGANAAAFGFAVLAGAALLGGIALTNWAIGVEVAGVGGGLAVLLLAALAAPDRAAVWRAAAKPPLGLVGLLIAAVVLQKLLIPVLAGAGFAPVIATERVSIAVLSSPGIALFLIGLAGLVFWQRALRRAGGPALAPLVAQRSWRALLTIAVFLIMARLLVESGGIGALSVLLADAGNYAAAAIVAGLAGVGAYVTGSAVPAAALFMPSAAAIGESFGQMPLFAALQHSAAGHTAMASLPIIAILLAALPARQRDDERTALRIGLQLAATWMTMVIASGWIQIASYN